MTRAAVIAFLLMASAGAAAAQTPCTYDACALRIQQKFFSGITLVQGQNARRVARVGLFAPRVDVLAAASDSAKAHYLSFRMHQNRGGRLLLVGAVAAGFAVGLASDHTYYREHEGLIWSLAGVGFVFSIWGGANQVSASDHLQQAMWFYNRDLPR